jgi:broad specificity phosphatase PhoE
LKRTVQTAELIARHHKIECATDPRWRELSFGLWEGLTYDEIQAREPDLLDKWQKDPENAAAPEGETLRQLAVRVASALEELRAEHEDHTILLTVHGGTIQSLLCLALGIELNHYWQFAVSSASLSEIRFYSEGAIINLFNDTSHIPKA